MDSDFSQAYKQSPTKLYPPYPKKLPYYPEPYQKSSKTPCRKSPYYPKQNTTYSKPNYKPQSKDQNMNQLAPRFQQRAMYSQHYRTDYDASWRANFLAAAYRTKYYNKNYETNLMKKFSNLGVRPEPEGAPSNNPEEDEYSSAYNNYDKVLSEETILYSDYGSDSDDFNAADESRSGQESEDQIPNSSWSTASLIRHAFNNANCNKVTVMTFAVIGAELHSITKMHSTKTEIELMQISKKAQKLTESIDKARKNLKEIALELRACKQEMKSKSNRSSNTNEKPHKHSVPSIQSKPESASNFPDKRKSIAVLEQVPCDQDDESNLPNYCTIDRRHRYYKERRSKRLSGPTLSMINYMNLDGVDKASSIN